jgi:hypothetical protein
MHVISFAVYTAPGGCRGQIASAVMTLWCADEITMADVSIVASFHTPGERFTALTM